MKNKITLSNPLTINNKKRTELTYDANTATKEVKHEVFDQPRPQPERDPERGHPASRGGSGQPQARPD